MQTINNKIRNEIIILKYGKCFFGTIKFKKQSKAAICVSIPYATKLIV